MTRTASPLKWHRRPAVAIPLRYAVRLAAMGPCEAIARAAGRVRKTRIPALPPWEPPARSACREWLARRFLFGPEEAVHICGRWRQACPERAAHLIALARRGLDRWDIFGAGVNLAPGSIDWQAGETRWVWELNRHQFFFTFARAFALTGDPAFPRRIAALLEDWLRQNPFGRGVNWSSALEAGVRALSWLWTLPLLIAWEGLDDDFFRRWLGSLHEHYEYLKSNLSVYTGRTNHLIGEAAALWVLSAALPGLPDHARQQQRALSILAREIERQVTPDGVGREQSTGYQRFVLDFYRQVLGIARRCGRPLPPVIGARIRAMENFLGALAGPGGPTPRIGDSDDARGVPFPELSGPVAWPDSPDLAFWLGELAERPAPVSPPRSRLFREGGYCLWEAEQRGLRMALLFDAGPLGLSPNAGHGHADALSVQVRLGTCWLLGDPGTGAYAVCKRVRDLLRATAAHNTVTVDRLSQADPLDTFKWLHAPRTRLLDSSSNDEYDYALAAHQGYLRLRRPVMHYRAVLFVRPPAPNAGWIILDRLEGEGRHHCALHFHFPPEAALDCEPPQSVLAIDPAQGAGLRLCFSQLTRSEEPVHLLRRSGTWSGRFGQWGQAPVISIESTAELPLAWFTFLSPESHGTRPAEPRPSRNGATVFCRRGDEFIEWTIRGKQHRFRYRRGGGCPGFFER
jgi:hypothetical protein